MIFTTQDYLDLSLHLLAAVQLAMLFSPDLLDRLSADVMQYNGMLSSNRRQADLSAPYKFDILTLSSLPDFVTHLTSITLSTFHSLIAS